MILTYQDPRFVARSSFSEKDTLKAAGFRWEPAQRVWYTEDPQKAVKLAAYADPSAKAKLSAIQVAEEAARAASRATDASITIPAPDGLAYLPYQKAGVAFTTSRRATLLGDQMGLGKTIQAIGTLAVTDEFPAVVVCPASLKLNWRREALKWMPFPDLAPVVIEGTPKSSIFMHPPGRLLLIINYDILGPWLPVLDTLGIKTVIYDECHYVKNRKALRSQAAVTLAKGKPRVLALSGTPIVNRPNELVNILELLGTLPAFGGGWAFLQRYAGAYRTNWGWDFSGASHLPELQERLRSTCMIRRLKEQVLTELPPKRRQVIELPADQVERRAVQNEQDGWARSQERLDALRSAVELAKASDNQEAYDEAVKALQAGTMAAFTELSELRHLTALSKVPLVIEHIQELLDNDVKVVLFAHHKDVIRRFFEAFPNSVVITGDTSLPDRQAAVDVFQTNPAIRLFIGSITAAGVGLTLTASSHVVFAELDWVPGNVSQCEDRTHRIGQTNSVLVQHLVLEGSLDATIAKRLIAKQVVIDAALDKEGTVPSMPLLPVPEQEQPATESATRKKIAEEALAIPKEQIIRIHAALQRLAGMCDGARELDGHGFNKLDTQIGHSLARQSSLSAKQAALALRILKRYPKQIERESYA